jgi:hypothetical protein
VFVNVNNFHPSILFVGKTRNLLLEWPPYSAPLGQAYVLPASLDFGDTH